MKRSVFNLSKILLYIGIGICLSPVVLYWIIHGSYERYMKIIEGPFPLSSFGGGHFQLFMYFFLALAGGAFILLSIMQKRK